MEKQIKLTLINISTIEKKDVRLDPTDIRTVTEIEVLRATGKSFPEGAQTLIDRKEGKGPSFFVEETVDQINELTKGME